MSWSDSPPGFADFNEADDYDHELDDSDTEDFFERQLGLGEYCQHSEALLPEDVQCFGEQELLERKQQLLKCPCDLNHSERKNVSSSFSNISHGLVALEKKKRSYKELLRLFQLLDVPEAYLEQFGDDIIERVHTYCYHVFIGPNGVSQKFNQNKSMLLDLVPFFSLHLDLLLSRYPTKLTEALQLHRHFVLGELLKLIRDHSSVEALFASLILHCSSLDYWYVTTLLPRLVDMLLEDTHPNVVQCAVTVLSDVSDLEFISRFRSVLQTKANLEALFAKAFRSTENFETLHPLIALIIAPPETPHAQKSPSNHERLCKSILQGSSSSHVASVVVKNLNSLLKILRFDSFDFGSSSNPTSPAVRGKSHLQSPLLVSDFSVDESDFDSTCVFDLSKLAINNRKKVHLELLSEDPACFTQSAPCSPLSRGTSNSPKKLGMERLGAVTILKKLVTHFPFSLPATQLVLVVENLYTLMIELGQCDILSCLWSSMVRDLLLLPECTITMILRHWLVHQMISLFDNQPRLLNSSKSYIAHVREVFEALMAQFPALLEVPSLNSEILERLHHIAMTQGIHYEALTCDRLLEFSLGRQCRSLNDLRSGISLLEDEIATRHHGSAFSKGKSKPNRSRKRLSDEEYGLQLNGTRWNRIPPKMRPKINLSLQRSTSFPLDGNQYSQYSVD